MAGSLETWRSVIDPLARNATVLAVDLPGHGSSSPGGGDYSLGSLAAGLRDVLTALGHDRATLVGHSLGGGIAMQFSYQFPEMTERLVLVSSGGLGLEVNPALRAASLPGANLFLSVTAEATRLASGVAGRVLARPTRLRGPVLTSSCAVTPRWPTPTVARRFWPPYEASSVSTVRPSAPETGSTWPKDLPVLLIWGAEDPIIPVEHARAAHELMPHSTLAVFDGVRHFPHVEAPQRFVTALEDFCASTEPAVFDAATWRARLRVTEAPD